MSDEFNRNEQNDGTKENTTYSWVNPKVNPEASSSVVEDDAIAKHAVEHVTSSWQEPDNSTEQENTRWESQEDYHQQQTQNQYYQVNDTVDEPVHAKPAGKKKEHRKTGPKGMGKRWCVNISMALVFGLVAGSVAYGVNYAGNKIGGSGATPTIQNTAVASGTSGVTNTSSSSGTAGEYTVSEVTQNAMPSMVAISTETVENVQSFFGTYSQTVPASGSGVIVGQNDTELLIATNNHVVEGATKVTVAFIDDSTVEASIKGTDADSDLAVVAVKLSDIPEATMNEIKIATLGDSDALEIGEGVVAIGNALGYGQSVTNGIVSATNRTVQTQSETTGQTTESTGLIQTNAAINPGNSGGALLNMKGELIGINEAKYSSTSVEGIGFAIPLAKAEPILENLMNLQTRDKVGEGESSYVGITGQNVSSELNTDYGVPLGVYVKSVEEDGPAADAGIQVKDVITEFDGRKISTMTDLQGALEYYAKGETVDVKIQRLENGTYIEKTVSVTLGDKSQMQTTTTEENPQQEQGQQQSPFWGNSNN